MAKMRKKEAVLTHRAHLLVSGRVQGVGFRYTVEKIALEIGLLGWVRNLPETRVEIVCEGTKENIELLTQKLKESSLGSNIKKIICTWGKPTLEFKDFCIEHYY